LLQERILFFKTFWSRSFLSVNNVVNSASKESRDNSWRSFMTTKSDFISGRSNAAKVKGVVMLKSRKSNKNEESEESGF
jgi:hypothetical protein